MVGLQELIHKFEVGEGTRYLKGGLAMVALLALAVIYDLREFKNFSSPEAMDTAQLARSLSEGEGYTTRFIRPLSMYLLQSRQREAMKESQGGINADSKKDLSYLQAPHPDISNPPLYPLLLAGLMKVAPFRFELPKSGSFSTYQPEILVALFNQALFLVAAIQLYRLAKRLFDPSVALVSTLLFVGGELFWRFSISGLSTMFLINLFLALASVIERLDDGLRGGQRTALSCALLAALGGLLVGAGCLTRYNYGWLILPLVALLLIYGQERRWLVSGAAIAAFLLVTVPWLARNQHWSGHWFGTAGFAVYAESKPFPSDHLERSLTPSFDKVEFEEFLRKLVVNGADIIQQDLPRLGGSWVSAFFVVGLLVAFRNPSLTRLRWFTLMALAVWGVAQALGRTYLSAETPVTNSENLLVIVSPLVFMFGTALFFNLLDQVEIPFPEARHLLTSGFTLLACAPLLLALLPPRTFPVAFPPYYPPTIQMLSGWMASKELMMSDVPWAVAWYGKRPAVWTVLNAKEDFFAIHDFQKPVSALYLTQRTTDAKFHSQMVKPQATSWEWFILQGLIKTNLPPGFPLKQSLGGFDAVGHFFLTDRERWLK